MPRHRSEDPRAYLERGAQPQRDESFLSAPLARAWTAGAGTSFQKERGVAVYAWGAWKEGRHARRHVHRGRRRSRHGFPAPLLPEISSRAVSPADRLLPERPVGPPPGP